MSLTPTTAAHSAPASTTISVDPNTVVGSVDHRLIGANQQYQDAMQGTWDPATNALIPSMDAAIRDMGLRALRYPSGAAGNPFQWRRAIGPQDQRLPQQSSQGGAPWDSINGPDEFGKILNEYGVSGNILINFGTGTAQDAADFVSYMTATEGPLAELRAQNGQPAPYDVEYWEIGNEIGFVGQNFWLGGSPTAADVAAGCTSKECRYLFGGYGHFTDQAVGRDVDFRAAASLSDGTAGQTFTVQYPPVVAGTGSVSVAGTTWTPVASLDSAGPGDQVYVLDEATGLIQFGDGAHGAVPPSGSAVRITYDSGPHDGFVDFYDAMKAANPDIKVCSGYGLGTPGTYFLSTAPNYDCVVSHPYISGPANKPLSEYHPELMADVEEVIEEVETLKDEVSQYNPAAEIIITEYGRSSRNEPTDFPGSSHMGLSDALFTANLIFQFADLDIPVAERQLLTYLWVFEEPPPDHPNPTILARYNALIAGPPPVVAQPTAKVMGLIDRSLGTTRVETSIAGNPIESTSGGDLPALNVIATTLDDGSTSLIVINQSLTMDVTADVASTVAHDPSVDVLTVNGPSAGSYNTREAPTTVDRVASQLSAGTGTFAYTFPAHSVTSLKLSAPQSWSSSTVYNTDDTVLYQGAIWQATWWTQNQAPGDPYGPWQEIASQQDGTAIWTPTRVFVAGDTAVYQGQTYIAQWWTRNQTPGQPYGPWQLVS